MTEDNSFDKSDNLTGSETEEKKEPEDAATCTSSGYEANANAEEGEAHSTSQFVFYMADEKGGAKGSQIVMDETVSSMSQPGKLNVFVHWPEKMVVQSNTRLLCSLPEVFKMGFSMKRPQESVSLYKCLEAFLKEEPLGPEDMWSVCYPKSLIVFFFTLLAGISNFSKVSPSITMLRGVCFGI